MSCYRVCEYCGAHLDPGERCDCGEGGLPWKDEADETEEDMDDGNASGG
ncbi:MAG: hypothetical protein VB104_07820 [Candidatus Limiplasma sp.]|nr:hypothetical protein [Candidatus Limiplasma sp.]